MTAGEEHHARSRRDGSLEDVIGERAARMRGHHQVAGVERYVVDGLGEERDATREARPFAHHRLRDLRGAGREPRIDGERDLRGVVEQEHQVCDEAVPAGEVHDATAAEAPPRATGELPRFVELLARQAIGFADGAADAIEERLALEMRGGAGRQLDAARVREANHARTVPGKADFPALGLTSERRGLPQGPVRGHAEEVSKAFTREDADASFELPPPTVRYSESRLTAYGARIVRERLSALELEHSQHASAAVDGTLAVGRLRDLLEGAEVVDPAGADHVALGARVAVQSDKSDVRRSVVIVTPDEVGLVPTGISAASPLAQVLLGAMVGDTVELDLPRGTEELTILAIDWPT
jgi:transcription elongation GreA/GreB family factor